MSQSVKPWIGLTAFVTVLILVGAWFLVISPTRQATADTRASIESEQDRTIMLQTALDTLERQFEDLEQSRAELEALSVQVPTLAEAAAFRRTLAERAASSGVTILSITTGASTTAAAAPQPAEPEPSEEEAATDSDNEEASPAPEDEPEVSAVTTASGQALVGIPLQVTLVGTYDAARAFIASMQDMDGRLYVVSGLGVVSQIETAGSGGRPDTVPGDVEVAIQGYLLVLTSGSDATGGEDEAEETELPPLPSTERNPFVPVS
jgi:hypothetical protein